MQDSWIYTQFIKPDMIARNFDTAGRPPPGHPDERQRAAVHRHQVPVELPDPPVLHGDARGLRVEEGKVVEVPRAVHEHVHVFQHGAVEELEGAVEGGGGKADLCCNLLDITKGSWQTSSATSSSNNNSGSNISSSSSRNNDNSSSNNNNNNNNNNSGNNISNNNNNNNGSNISNNKGANSSSNNTSSSQFSDLGTDAEKIQLILISTLPSGFAFVCLIFGGRRNVELGEVRHANVDDVLCVIQISVFYIKKYGNRLLTSSTLPRPSPSFLTNPCAPATPLRCSRLGGRSLYGMRALLWHF